MKTASIILCLMLLSSCTITQLINNKKSEELIAANKAVDIEIDKRIFINSIFKNGEVKKMALDLGAGTTILLKNSGLEYIDLLSPVLSFGKSISADNKKITNNYYDIDTVKSEGFILANAFLPVVSSPINAQCNKTVGVWGADIFSDKILILNMADSTLAVLDTLPSISDWILLESKYKYPYFYVFVKLGNEKVKLLLDTGSASAIVMSKKSFHKKFSENDSLFTDHKKLYGSTFISASGTITDTVTTMICKSAGLGSYFISPFKITLSNKIKRNVIGMDIIQRLNIMIDYTDKNIYIQRNPNYANKVKQSFFELMGLSLRNSNDDKILVFVIQLNSMAEKAGLKVGDQIISVNNIKANEGDNCEVVKRISELDGKSMQNTVIVKRGTETLSFRL